ncbi:MULTISPECIES: LytR C-terminal domain-containing protein [unclassified Streptomyces]|uniref:LytR C-terminal domain-containing protein n=1 Tax=unclassified Streptomyces TaxID=2593676 RepID=UPI002741438A|nr:MULTISPECIES: LytR C-terminal domain-containing protein [unclassified Streptomyces]
MGGQYRITGNKYPRMRRPRRHGRLVLLVVASAAALGVIGWGTLQLIDVFTGGKKASAAGAGTHCATDAAAKSGPSPSHTAHALPKPGQITVNVLNATPRSGLAKQTADELKKRGFRIGQVGNATKEFDKKIKGSGILLGPASSLNTSLPVLATQLPGAESRTDTRKGTDVDLIIGDGFKQLAQKPAADKALAALNAPQPTSTAKKGC